MKKISIKYEDDWEDTNTGELLTVSQVAKRFNRNPSGVRANIARGALRAVKIGHIYLISLDEAAHFYENKK